MSLKQEQPLEFIDYKFTLLAPHDVQAPVVAEQELHLNEQGTQSTAPVS